MWRAQTVCKDICLEQQVCGDYYFVLLPAVAVNLQECTKRRAAHDKPLTLPRYIYVYKAQLEGCLTSNPPLKYTTAVARGVLTQESSSPLISRLLFAWVWPLIRDGYSRAQTDMGDLFPLPAWLSAELWCNRVREARRKRVCCF